MKMLLGCVVVLGVMAGCAPRYVVVMRDKGGDVQRCHSSGASMGRFGDELEIRDCVSKLEDTGYARDGSAGDLGQPARPRTRNENEAVRRSGMVVKPPPCSAAERDEMRKAGVSTSAIVSACGADSGGAL